MLSLSFPFLIRYQFPPFSFADAFPIKQTALIFILACILSLNLFVYLSCPPHSPCAKRLLIAEKLTRCLTPKKKAKKVFFLLGGKTVFFSHGHSSTNSRHRGQHRTHFATTPYLSSATLLLLCTYYSIFPQTSPPAFSPISRKEILHFPFVKLTLGQFILIAEMLSACGQPSKPWKICRCWRHEERDLSQCSWFSTANSSPEVWGDAALASLVSKLFIYEKLYLFHLNSSLRLAEILKQHGLEITLWQRIWTLCFIQPSYQMRFSVGLICHFCYLRCAIMEC